MKNFKHLLLLLITSLLFSCSEEEHPTSTPAGTVNIVYDNSPVSLVRWKAERDGDYFRISASSENSETWSFTAIFHKDGTLIRTYVNDSSIQNEYETSFYYSRNTFEFNIESIDEINNTIKVNFNGKVFDNPNYLPNSGFKTMSGTFEAPFVPISPYDVSFAKHETTMQINGEPWRGKGQISNVDFWNGTAIQVNGDQQYSLHIVVPTDIELGTFTFTQNDDIYEPNTVSLLRYYPGSPEPNEYRCTGSLTITSKSQGAILGTFSMTAYDPATGETVEITNGVFKERY